MYATSSRLLVFVCPSIFCCQRSFLVKRSQELEVGSWNPDRLPLPSRLDATCPKTESRSLPTPVFCLLLLVGLGGIEPPTSPLSGVRSSQLSYRPAPCAWWSWSGSNRRPPECKSGALPSELQPLHLEESGTRSREWDYRELRSASRSPDSWLL
jgi:hypothetical protein